MSWEQFVFLYIALVFTNVFGTYLVLSYFKKDVAEEISKRLISNVNARMSKEEEQIKRGSF